MGVASLRQLQATSFKLQEIEFAGIRALPLTCGLQLPA
jgi:hypothetical protein